MAARLQLIVFHICKDFKLKNKNIEILVSNMTAHWRKSNELPRINELILVQFTEVAENFIDRFYIKEDGSKFPLWFPKNERFSIGYVEKDNEKDNKRIFYPWDFMMDKYEVNWTYFSNKVIEKWIYINEIVNLNL